MAHDAGPKTQVPCFLPERTPGLNLLDFQTRQDISKFLRPVDFFRLFFTVDIVHKMCDWTNVYVGEQRKSLYARWTKVDVDEFYRLIGLLMYMSWVRVPRFCQYWSEDTLLNGLWARRFMAWTFFVSNGISFDVFRLCVMPSTELWMSKQTAPAHSMMPVF